MIYTGVLEQTAVSRIHPSVPVFGRDRMPIFGDDKRVPEERTKSLPVDERPTDATGLSISQEDLSQALDAFEQEKADRSHELAYRAAGSRSGRLVQQDPASSGSVVASSGAQAAPAFASGALTQGEASDIATGAKAQVVEKQAEALQAVGGEGRSASRTFMGEGEEAQGNNAGEEKGLDGEDLTEEEQLQLQELKNRDKEVRTHEQAHISASGGLALGGASYQQTRGPDGQMYATGGEVQIDTSEGTTPEETIAKAQRIRTAALAPAEPSGQDKQVAAQANQMEAEARREKTEEPQGTEAGLVGKSDAAEKGELKKSEEETEASSKQTVSNSEASGRTGRLAMQMERAQALYSRMAEDYGLTSWGTGISYAV